MKHHLRGQLSYFMRSYLDVWLSTPSFIFTFVFLGEKGIYYEDLYPLIKPLHIHDHGNTPHNQAQNGKPSSETVSNAPSTSNRAFTNPVIPPINAYGTIPIPSHRLVHEPSAVSLASTSSSSSSFVENEHQPLLSSSLLSGKRRKNGLVSSVSQDLIPFSGIVSDLLQLFRFKRQRSRDIENGVIYAEGEPVLTHAKHRPRIAGGGENIPLEIIRALSCWLSVLEERGCIYGEFDVVEISTASWMRWCQARLLEECLVV